MELANERGETHMKDTEATASFCVYGQLNILLDQEIPREERVHRVKASLIDVLKFLWGKDSADCGKEFQGVNKVAGGHFLIYVEVQYMLDSCIKR